MIKGNGDASGVFTSNANSAYSFNSLVDGDFFSKNKDLSHDHEVMEKMQQTNYNVCRDFCNKTLYGIRLDWDREAPKVPKRLQQELNREIEKMKQNERVDYHPGSSIVRDIVHPSLYPYAHHKTKMMSGDETGS